jgi:hypothetical protein
MKSEALARKPIKSGNMLNSAKLQSFVTTAELAQIFRIVEIECCMTLVGKESGYG